MAVSLSKFMTPPRAIGFFFGVLISCAYLMWGTWGKIPGYNFAQPQPRWAQVLYWTGVQAGHWCFSQLSQIFTGEISKNISACIGVVVMGVTSLIVFEILRLFFKQKWMQ